MNTRLKTTLLAGGAAALLFAPLALGHVWIVVKGIHFKGPGVDFGAPPSRYAIDCDDGMGLDEAPEWRPGTYYYFPQNDDPQSGISADEHNTELANKAFRLEKQKRYGAAGALWRKLLAKGPTTGWAWKARERIALYQVAKGHPKGLEAFLEATATPYRLKKLPDPSKLAPAIKPFVLYEQAEINHSPDGFLRLQAAYPHSMFADAALIMAPRLLLDGPIGTTPADLRTSRKALDILAAQYPHSRFSTDALGLRGRICYLEGDYVGALRWYRKQAEKETPQGLGGGPIPSMIHCHRELGNRPAVAADYLLYWMRADSDDAHHFAVRLFQNTLDDFTAADARRFWSILRGDPALLTAYVDYRADFTTPTPDLLQLVGAPKSPHILARLSQAAYGMSRFADARKLALRSLDRGAKRDDEALDDFVLASCAKRRNLNRYAIQTYRRVLEIHPHGYLAGGAKENLAILYERTGELGAALDIYRSLGYTFDFAYMIDARMSPEQLAAYVAEHPNDRRISLFRFSLGLRYLRTHQFAKAESVLAGMTARQRRRFCGGDLRSVFDDAIHVPDPLVTARNLARLSARTQGVTGVKKARSLLALADYYYAHRDLLLYNAELWQGERAYVIGFSWNNSQATPADQKALTQHHWEHECYAQAYRLYRQAMLAAAHNPRLRALAAYRGAVALEHLGNMNAFWRSEQASHDLLAKTVALMRVAVTSPDPALRNKALKYKFVFSEERKDLLKDYADWRKEEGPRQRPYSGFAAW